MSDRPESSDDESRKRPWLSDQLDTEVTPPKRSKKSEKSKGFGGFFFAPFNHLFGMFAGEDKKKSTSSSPRERHRTTREYEYVDNEEDDNEVLVEKVSPKRAQQQEYAGPIIYLNQDRQRAGSEEVVVERHIQKDVLVPDDPEDDVEEIPVVEAPPPSRNDELERSFEAQQDDEPDIIFENVVITPNRQLQAAKRFETELIYLNDNPDTPDDDISVISDTRSKDFVSPGPDDSVSRPQTPIGFSNYSSNSVRDFWKRTGAKSASTVQRRPPMRHQFKHSSLSQKQRARQNLISRNRLFEGVVASGQYDVKTIMTETKPQRKVKSAAELMARAQDVINGSRSNTPSMSRESSVIFEGTSMGRQRTPNSSSSDLSTRNQKVSDILSRINNLAIGSTHRGPQRYEKSYEQTKCAETRLLEEARIRAGYSAQTKGDTLEDVRKRLELQGIAIRPKPPKKVIDDFMVLPDAADMVIEKAWNNGLSANEQFVDAFNIQIVRKDLATLSGLHWLNDNVINYYLQLICDRSARDSKYPKTYAFNTFFYTNIITKGYASVKRWTRKCDIFSYEIILVPVHLGMHWCMAVIDMVEQKIEFYDSLYDGNTAVLPALKNYLTEESKDKKKAEFDFKGWTIRQMEDIPRQQNGSDCGVFSCQFGEWASRRTTPRFTQKNMPYYRKRMVYEIVSKKLLATI